VFPLRAVASVVPELGPRGAVFLNVDRTALDQPPAERALDEELRARLQPYIAERYGSANKSERHLLFVSTRRGYRLLERDGPVPEMLERVSLADDSFRVVKLAASPLPGDRRMCAYLEQS
jgi:hypothetical protein